MSDPTNPLLALSQSLSGLAERLANPLVGVVSHGRLVASGFAWKADAAVTASDALEADDEISLLLGDGRTLQGTLAGRDPTTDIALISVRNGTLAPLPNAAAKGARVGALVLALGRGKEGVTANLGMVSAAGGPWQSMRGGSIDSLLRPRHVARAACRGRPCRRCARGAAGHGGPRAAPAPARHPHGHHRADRAQATRRRAHPPRLSRARIAAAQARRGARTGSRAAEPARHHGGEPRSQWTRARGRGLCRRRHHQFRR